VKLSRGRPLDAAIAGVLLLAVLAAFGPILGHGFVFDDFALIVQNPGIRGLDAARLRWMFSSTYLTTYMPLGWASFAAVFSLRGLDPAAFHAANLAAHWLVAVALFAAARRLFRLAGNAKPEAPAFAAALLFCVHPFQANTVAWAIELPDMLSTLFFLLAVFVYLGRASRPRTVVVFGLFLVSLLFRWKSLSLPLVLVGLDYWPLGRLRARLGDPFDQERVGVWAEKAPFVILAVAAASLTLLAKSREVYAPSFAPAAAARSLWLYPRALLWPKNYLAAYALHGAGNSLGLPAWAALGAAALLTAVLWLGRRRRPALLLAWACYAAAVLPPALNAQHGSVYVYLAYGYLGCLGLFVLAGAAVRRGPALAFAGALALALIAGSRREIRHWSDPVAFWAREVALDPGFSPAYGQLGGALLERGRYDEAFRCLAARLAAAPADEEAAADMEALGRAAPALKEEAARQLARAASLRDRTP
jgi:hypothetical protein